MLVALLQRGFVDGSDRTPVVLSCGRRSTQLLKRLRPAVSVTEEPTAALLAAGFSSAEFDAALVVLPARGELASDPLSIVRALAARLRPGAVVVVRTPARAPQRLRMQLCAAFLHAGLTDLRQQSGGRGLFTAGRRIAGH